MTMIKETVIYDRLNAESFSDLFQPDERDELLRSKVLTERFSKETDEEQEDRDLLLEVTLESKRIQSLWNPEQTIEDLLIRLKETDLSLIELLVQKTSDVVEVAYKKAMEGRVISLAAVLMLAPEKVTIPIVVVRPPDGIIGSKETTTIYECVIREALSLGQKGASSSKANCNYCEKRKLLLFQIELLQIFGASTAVTQGDLNDRMTISPLIRAAQAIDEAVLKLLLKTNVEINETDAEGNSALHWCIRCNTNSKKQARVIALLLEHGASVSQRNRLGMTSLHIAAGSGNVVALQILLHKDQDCVDAVSLMKETPLFLAVKNDFKDCVKLLLRYGANTKILNLCKQRPIEMSYSQDTRFLVSPVNSCFGNRNSVPVQESASSGLNRCLQLDNSDGDLAEPMLSRKKETIASSTPDERVIAVAKTEVCKYFESPGGCIRGSELHFVHEKEELLRSSNKHKSALSPVCDQDTRKIFIGGLPPSLDSETVEEALVMIGSTQAAEDHEVHSREFGFVNFKNEKSVGQDPPSWLSTFRKWLPRFLVVVSKRLSETFRIELPRLLGGTTALTQDCNCKDRKASTSSQSQVGDSQHSSPKGTTLVLLVVEEGIVVAADTRTSYYTGSYANSKFVIDKEDDEKIERLGTNLMCASAGSVSHIDGWLAHLKDVIKHAPEQIMHVVDAVNFLVRINKKRRIKDKYKCHLFLIGRHGRYVRAFYLNARGSFEVTDKYFAGSGGHFANMTLQNQYKKDMTMAEAVNLARRSIYDAFLYDPHTGGSVAACIFTKELRGGKMLTPVKLEKGKSIPNVKLEDLHPSRKRKKMA